MNSAGFASLPFIVAPGTDPAFAGLVLHHAALGLGTTPGLTVEFISSPVPVELAH